MIRLLAIVIVVVGGVFATAASTPSESFDPRLPCLFDASYLVARAALRNLPHDPPTPTPDAQPRREEPKQVEPVVEPTAPPKPEPPTDVKPPTPVAPTGTTTNQPRGQPAADSFYRMRRFRFR